MCDDIKINSELCEVCNVKLLAPGVLNRCSAPYTQARKDVRSAVLSTDIHMWAVCGNYCFPTHWKCWCFYSLLTLCAHSYPGRLICNVSDIENIAPSHGPGEEQCAGFNDAPVFHITLLKSKLVALKGYIYSLAINILWKQCNAKC